MTDIVDSNCFICQKSWLNLFFHIGFLDNVKSLLSGSDFPGEELGKCRGVMAYTLGNLVWSLRTSYTDQQNI